MNWKKDGFGDSGETYIIGSDGKMKSVARKLIEEDGKYKAGFMQSLKENNINDSIYQKIDKFDTTIGMADVKTEAANKASNGGTGWIIASNYLGENTISSYSPLDIKDVNWSIVSEMQTNEAFMSITQLSQSIIMWGVGILIVALLLSIFLGNSITSPIARSSATLKDISQGDGDLTSRFDQNDNSNDHTDKLARYFNIFIDKIHRIVKDVTGVSSQLETSSTDGGNIAEELSNAALQLKNSSEASSTAITQMDNQLQTAASSGDEISSLMKNVSAAVTQMAATTKEMAGQCSESASQARFANDKSQESGVVMKQLTEAAEKIGAVVDTISDIADKTDLLALNATIEAASAGEAGKGFAVVATEIKELSKQTQGATGEISSLIEGIRDTAQNASNSSLEISKIVTELNNILEGIAAGVEEMAATAQEVDSNVLSASNGADDIASNIKEISKGSGDFKGNILEISKYAESTEANANKSSKVAKQLNELSDLLKSQVSQFKV
jgi:methyl-accepting chemotaxis protein